MGVERVIAVDWSGDRSAAHRKIWLCEAADGKVVRLEKGRPREEIVEHLISEAEREPSVVVGLDFAFSFPRRFLRKRAHRRVDSVWEEAERLGENWLQHCPFPFWGKPGSKKPALGDLIFRRTEIEIREETGLRPLSGFQIGGAGAVGVGSIRGMPFLRRLRGSGFSIWPFDPPKLPMVIEIWPRLFLGRLKKSRAVERTRFIRAELPGLDRPIAKKARESDDALDALVSALAMDRHRDELAALPQVEDRRTLLEGAIWRPAKA